MENHRKPAKERISKNKMAEMLGVHHSTISRELKRGEITQRDILWKEYTSYCADVVQDLIDSNTTAKGPSLKLGKDQLFHDFVEYWIIEKKYSPDAVIMKIENEGLSFETRFVQKPSTTTSVKVTSSIWQIETYPVEVKKSKEDIKEQEMYSKEQRETALQLHDEFQSVTKVIQKLGYPSRQGMYKWLRGRSNPPEDKAERKRINNSKEHPLHPSVETKFAILERCFMKGENVQLVSEETGYSRTSIYRWRKLYVSQGVAALMNEKDRPRGEPEEGSRPQRMK